MKFLKRQWFLIALCLLLPGGVILGQNIEGFSRSVDENFDTSPFIFAILFAMSVTLPTGKIWQTAARPGPVILAFAINMAVLPLATWGLIQLLPLKIHADGLLIMAAVPTTLASAAVWTRKAGGNDVIPLMATLIGNLVCFLTIPFWLEWTLGQSIELDPFRLMGRLLWVAVLPMSLAQLTRLIPSFAQLVDRQRMKIGTAAQIGILTIIFASAIRSGPMFQQQANESSLLSSLLLLVVCIAIHGIGLICGWQLTRRSGNSPEDAIGVAFSGSQKTLPIAIELATSPAMLASGISPLAIIPPLIYHASQLILDTLLIAKFRKTCSHGPLETTPQPNHPSGE